MFLILGGDLEAAARLPGTSPSEVLEHATVAVVERTGWTRNGIGIRIGRLRADRVRYLDMPLIQISSTCCAGASEGVPIRYLVPPAVEDSSRARAIRAGGRHGDRDRGHEGMTGATRDPTALADRIASVASGRKAIDIRLIDLRGIVSYTDFFVICSGNTERQTKAIHDAIYEDLKHDPDRLLPGAPKATATPAGSCSTTGTSWCTSSHRMRASTTAWRTSGARAPARSVG